MLNAILYWLNTEIPWRDLPERYGPWQTVSNRFRAWTKAGAWERAFHTLVAQNLVDETTVMLKSTTVKVHQHGSEAKKRGYNEETGRSRGRLTTKVHMVTDGLGNPLRFLLTGGNRNDICVAKVLLEPFNLMKKMVLADKGYDSDKFVKWVKERGGIVVILSRVTAKHPRQTDWHTYKERYLIENLFLKLKNNRRFVIRYEKKSVYFQAVTFIACILV
jgi:Transposase and inactivated derivatives